MIKHGSNAILCRPATSELQRRMIKKHYSILRLKTLIFLFTFLFITGCASQKAIKLYEADPASKNDIVTLTMPVEIDVVYVDGQRVNYLPGYQPQISYTLLPGNHLLGFKYQDMLTDDEGNNESINSRTVLIRFDAKAGQQYEINFTRPKTVEQALILEKTLKLTMSYQGNVITKSFPAPQSPSTSWFNSNSFNGNTMELFDEEALLAENDAGEPNQNTAPAGHLKFWWKKASDEERADFTRWLKDNP